MPRVAISVCCVSAIGFRKRHAKSFAAFDPSAKVGNYRQRGDIEMIDITTVNGDTVTLSVSKDTHLPVSVTSRADQPNLFGDEAP